MIVKRGISRLQAKQLIKFTKTDEAVGQFTQDQRRFKNLATFKKWQKGKTIYTLTDKGGGLLGIIWFGEKKHPALPDHPYTFAIRVYPSARGKGYAFKFMKKAFADFKPEGVWLSTRPDNLPAIKLYKKFGFRELSRDPNELIMIL